MNEELKNRIERTRQDAMNSMAIAHTRYGRNFVPHVCNLMVIQTLDAFEEYGVPAAEAIGALHAAILSVGGLYAARAGRAPDEPAAAPQPPQKPA